MRFDLSPVNLLWQKGRNPNPGRWLVAFEFLTTEFALVFSDGYRIPVPITRYTIDATDALIAQLRQAPTLYIERR